MKQELLLLLLLTEACHASKEDTSRQTWAHGVNNRQKLMDALNGDIDILEADISYGYVKGEEPPKLQPIMAHPPDEESELSLEKWIDIVLGYKSRGVKLDFKAIEAVEVSLKILKPKEKMIKALWLNADILPGPVNAMQTPVDAHLFLRNCTKFFPKSTLSVGWTTYLNASVTGDKQYSWDDVINMAKLLKTIPVRQPVTFPVRAAFVGNSTRQLKWLTDVIKDSTLTVWGATDDDVDVNDLLLLRSTFPRDRIYYDLPSPLFEEFQQHKDDVRFLPQSSHKHRKRCNELEASNWLVEHEDCAYTGSGTIVFFGTCFTFYQDQRDQMAALHTISAVIEFKSSLTNVSDEGIAIVLLSNPWVWIYLYSNGSIRYQDEDEDVRSSEFELEGSRCLQFKVTVAGRSGSIKLRMWSLDCSSSSPTELGALDLVLDLPRPHYKSRNLFALKSLGEGNKIVRSLNVGCIHNINHANHFSCKGSIMMIGLIVNVLMLLSI